MIPILFPKNAITFTSNGLGRLSDAISCIVTEERNGKYELSMEYPIDGVHFEDIEISSVICAVPADGKAIQPFRVYKVEKLIKGRARINAEHISYQARYIPVMPFTAGSCVSALQGLSSNAVVSNPFTLWTDISKAGTYTQDVPESIRARLGGQEGSILDVYGGELEWDNYTIKLHARRGHDSGVTLRYGKNITDLTQEKNITNTYTAVCPYYQSSDDNECLTLPEKYIASDNAGSFPYLMAKSVDMTSEFEDGESVTVESLRAKTQAYITKNNIGVPAVSIKVSFVALWQTEEYKNIAALERVNLCDTVNVLFEKLGVSATAKVVRTNYNVLIDRYDSIELGETKTQLSSMIANQNTDIEAEITGHMQKAIAHATALIRGGLGGYVVMTPNPDTGYPEEILIMNKPVKEQASQVIRMNKNGIGFSLGNGYEGPFTSAWTIDGHFYANFIDAGVFNADLIQAGRIQALNDQGQPASDNYWDMVTGEFHLAANTKIGNQFVANREEIASGIQQYDGALNQVKVFNKLTNNGQTQGIFLQNNKLYINAGYIATGIITDKKRYNYWNMDTGEFQLVATTKVGNSTVASKADVQSGINTYDSALNQRAVFNKLTNNGANQGIFLTGNTLYINAGYIATGIISDKKGYNYWNMDTGEFSLKATTKVGNSTIASQSDVSGAKNYADNAASGAESRAKTYASSEAKNQAKAYMESYDQLLNQQAVFNKLTNYGAVQGISLTDGNLYINASYISTGILTDKKGNFWLNMDTGIMHMQGANFDSWIKGCTFTGNKFQTAESGQRIMMDQSSTIKGMNNETLHNFINMEQVISGTHQMTLEAASQMNIRTDKLCVVQGHYGMNTNPVNVYETANDSDDDYNNDAIREGRKCWRLNDVYKIMYDWPYPHTSTSYPVKELDLVDVGQQTGSVHVTLPVLLEFRYKKERRRLGMITTENKYDSIVV